MSAAIDDRNPFTAAAPSTRWRMRDIACAATAFALLLLVQVLLVAAEGGGPGTPILDVVAALFPTTVTAVLVLTLARSRGIGTAGLGFARPSSWRPAFFAWAGAVASGPLFAGALVLFGVQAPSTFRVPPAWLWLSDQTGVGGLWPYAVGVVVVAPLAEEVVFRGLLYRFIRQRWALGPALALSGIFFAAAHFQPTTLVPLIAIGALFSWSFERSRSLWGSIAPHAGLNALTLLVYLARVH